MGHVTHDMPLLGVIYHSTCQRLFGSAYQISSSDVNKIFFSRPRQNQDLNFQDQDQDLNLQDQDQDHDITVQDQTKTSTFRQVHFKTVLQPRLPSTTVIEYENIFFNHIINMVVH